jgi:transposase
LKKRPFWVLLVAHKEVAPITALETSLGPSLTETEARAIFAQGEEAVVFALLTLAKMASSKQNATGAESPSTPSGMKATFLKPSAKSRNKKPGRPKGHQGERRPTPTKIDQRVEHRADVCPDCGGPLQRCQETRTRIIEDIPEIIEPVVTEHTIHRDYCPTCKKKVEPKVPDALPGSQIGLRVLTLTAWLHYGLGVTLSQIIDVFNFHLQFKLSAGGLIQMWYRLQEILYAWYEEIQNDVLNAKVMFADETGWRVKGKTWWLWCFTTADATYYLIDRCRGSPVIAKFFKRVFQGILVSDFWGAYNAVQCLAKQKCIPHLLRETVRVQKYEKTGRSWRRFAKKLRRLLRDAIRLGKHSERAAPDFVSKRQRLKDRLQKLLDTPWKDKHARRLVKRLRRHQHELFTFLDHEEVPHDNNTGERAIRPAVIIRKNSYANRSEEGADMQAVLMSIFRTLKQRGHNPLRTIVSALRTFVQTGKLPPLPGKATSDS